MAPARSYSSRRASSGFGTITVTPLKPSARNRAAVAALICRTAGGISPTTPDRKDVLLLLRAARQPSAGMVLGSTPGREPSCLTACDVVGDALRTPAMAGNGVPTSALLMPSFSKRVRRNRQRP